MVLTVLDRVGEVRFCPSWQAACDRFPCAQSLRDHPSGVKGASRRWRDGPSAPEPLRSLGQAMPQAGCLSRRIAPQGSQNLSVARDDLSTRENGSRPRHSPRSDLVIFFSVRGQLD